MKRISVLVLFGGIFAAIAVHHTVSQETQAPRGLQPSAPPPTAATPGPAPIGFPPANPGYSAPHQPQMVDELRKLAKESIRLSREYRAAKGEEGAEKRQSIRDRLQTTLEKEFELRQQLHGQRAKDLRHRLEKVEASIETRKSNNRLHPVDAGDVAGEQSGRQSDC